MIFVQGVNCSDLSELSKYGSVKQTQVDLQWYIDCVD